MIKKLLAHQLKRGKFTFVGKPLWKLLIDSQLYYARWKDNQTTFANASLLDNELTAIIKTFERHDVLQRLIDSIKRFYPNMKIIVVDDSADPQSLEGTETIILPYDSGVSIGRQKALEAVKTPYVLLLDDDFIFYRETNLVPALEIIKDNSQIDIMGGEVIDMPFFKSADYLNAPIHKTDAESIFPKGKKIANLPVYDKVPNFYIARTERLKLVGWDKNIKRLDHADFFTRAKGVLVTVYNKNFKVLHAQTPFNKTYMEKRNDVQNDRFILQAKYYNNH